MWILSCSTYSCWWCVNLSFPHRADLQKGIFSQKPTVIWICLACTSTLFLHMFVSFFSAWNISDQKVTNIIPTQATQGLNLSLCLCVWILSKSSDVLNPRRILPCHCLKILARYIFLADFYPYAHTNTHRHVITFVFMRVSTFVNHPLTHSLCPFLDPKIVMTYMKSLLKENCATLTTSCFSNCEDLQPVSVLCHCKLYIVVLWTVG